MFRASHKSKPRRSKWQFQDQTVVRNALARCGTELAKTDTRSRVGEGEKDIRHNNALRRCGSQPDRRVGQLGVPTI